MQATSWSIKTGVRGREENKEDAATRHGSRGMMGIALSPTVNTAISARSVQRSTRQSTARHTHLPVTKGREEGQLRFVGIAVHSCVNTLIGSSASTSYVDGLTDGFPIGFSNTIQVCQASSQVQHAVSGG